MIVIALEYQTKWHNSNCTAYDLKLNESYSLRKLILVAHESLLVEVFTLWKVSSHSSKETEVFYSEFYVESIEDNCEDFHH